MLILRPATEGDTGVLYRWRMEPEAVRWSQTGVLDLAAHAAWVRTRIQAPGLWIAERDGAPVGMGRVDDYCGTGVCSLAVDPDGRRQGVGWQILDALQACDRPVVGELRAIIHEGHLVSRRLFVSQGFTRQTGAGPWLRYTKRRD